MVSSKPPSVACVGCRRVPVDVISLCFQCCVHMSMHDAAWCIITCLQAHRQRLLVLTYMLLNLLDVYLCSADHERVQERVPSLCTAAVQVS
jgi:hypothetical protein